MKLKLSILFALLLSAVSALQAADGLVDRQVTLNIAAQPMQDALNDLARQTGLQVAVYSDISEGLTAPTVAGNLTPRDALKRLLKGTELTYDVVGGNTINIRSAKTTADAADAGSIQVAQTERLSMKQAAAAAEQTPERPIAANDNEENGKIQEVIVTAQKRQERLQDVPIAITVLSGEALDKATVASVNDALNRIPGVSTTPNSTGGTLVNVRGVSASGPLFAGPSPIGYYLDSVPFGLARTGIAPDANAYDLQRVEVLRGPQGTLYGASALNGVVRVLTNDADPRKFEFKTRASASSTKLGSQNYRGDMAVNVPIVNDKLAVRAVVGYQDIGGWIDRPIVGHEDANDSQILTTRLKVNAEPTEALSVALLGWFSRADYGAWQAATTREAYPSLTDEPQTNDYDIGGLKVDYRFAGMTLTSMTSHMNYKQNAFTDGRTTFGTPPVAVRTQTNLHSQVFSEEMLLNSASEGAWRWSLGGMYRNAEDHNYQFRINRVAPIDWTDTSESIAFFGQASRLFDDGKFELTAGLRYFKDDVSVDEHVRSDGTANPVFVRDSKFDAVTPRVVLTAHPNTGLSVYASYSEGFRSGFDQTPLALLAAPQFAAAEPDDVTNYEIGAKGSLWDGRLAFESALYYIDWQDIQQLLAVPTGFTTIAAVVNAGSASGVGADASLSARLAPGLELGVNANWNNLEFDENILSFGAVLFAKGERPNYSPKSSVGVFADYDFALASGYSAQFSVSGNYVSQIVTRGVSPGVANVAHGDSLLTGRTSFAITAPSHWSASLFIDNVTDEDGKVLGSTANPLANVYTQPRTIGLQLEYRL